MADGKLLAYNQLVKHDFHDWDVDSPAPLVTTREATHLTENNEPALSTGGNMSDLARARSRT